MLWLRLVWPMGLPMRRFLYCSHVYAILVVASSFGAGFGQVLVSSVTRWRGHADQKKAWEGGPAFTAPPAQTPIPMPRGQGRRDNHFNANALPIFLEKVRGAELIC